MRRVGVVGAGPMGQLHARAIARRAASRGDVELAWTLDHHPARSEAVARAYGGRVGRTLDEIAAGIDVAVVAVPAVDHVEVSGCLLEAGVDVMVEKPMARDWPSARALADRARALGRVLAVGHVEWFNAELERARAAVCEGCRIEVVRAMPASSRGLDLDVVQDLMLHDLDWIARIHGGAVELLRARGSATPLPAAAVEGVAAGESVVDAGRADDPAYVDEAEVELGLPGGGTATLRASRRARARERSVHVERGGVSLRFDLLAFAPAREAEDGEGAEPLDRAWADFLQACSERSVPENDAEAGVAAVALVERVQSALRRGGLG